MSLTQRITDDMKAAMKQGEKLRLETLRMIRAQILEFEKKGLGREMTGDDELSILATASKKRKEAIEQFKLAGRDDLAEKETKELEIIAGYLPKQLTREEAKAIVDRIVQESGAASVKEMGKVMPLAMKELKGRVDSALISELVRQALGGSP
ncbi:MAG TPA: GatB/YqeY domain-containing protein [Bacteroidota bacterium]|nr:GatB/YqeY domain-containing protein [Bacteroidota bacterium]